MKILQWTDLERKVYGVVDECKTTPAIALKLGLKTKGVREVMSRLRYAGVIVQVTPDKGHIPATWKRHEKDRSDAGGKTHKDGQD
jgi:hypothetical protein